MSKNKRAPGQSTLEFTFAMVAVVLLIMGMIRIFHWAGNDMAARRAASEFTGVNLYCGGKGCQAFESDLFTTAPINAAVSSNIFGND